MRSPTRRTDRASEVAVGVAQEAARRAEDGTPMSTRRESVHILEADPGLGEELSGGQLAAARGAVVASVQRLGTGLWRGAEDQVPAGGFLVLEGCIAREVSILGQTAAIEFLAEGDLLRPSGEVGAASVDSRVVWRCSTATSCSLSNRGRS